MFGLDYTIFRPHNVYGERQNVGDRYRNVVGIFMNQLLQGEPMTIFGDGEQERAFTHIDDVAPAIADAVDMPRRATRCSTSAPTCLSRSTIWRGWSLTAMGRECKIRYLDARNEVKVAFSDHSKADRVIRGSRRRRRWRDGIKAMAEWVTRHGARTSSIFEGIEIEKNLPASWAAVKMGV